MAADAPPSSSHTAQQHQQQQHHNHNQHQQPPQHQQQQRSNASGSGSGSGGRQPHQPICSPEELFFHVAGHWPKGHPSAATGIPPTEFLAEPIGARDGDGRRKKRRKVGARGNKTSEIWGEEAEFAFCTAIASIPPNGRTKIKFCQRPLGRNELIAAICTLATKRPYNRKQISSHSQVLKDKVPPPYKEIFTFEDKSRAGEDAGESATANVIENYKFPEAIYKLLGLPLTEDLTNMPRPAWLDKDVNPPPGAEPPAGPGGFWYAGAPEYDYYRQGAPYAREKDRDGRVQSSMDSSYYAYSQPMRHQELPTYGTGLPPPLPLDPQSPITAQASTDRRYASYGSSSVPFSSRLPISSFWDGDHSRSPTTSSQFDGQSQSSGVSPRHMSGAGWTDTKPSIAAVDHLSLPHLQDQQGDWKGWSLSSQQQQQRGPSLAPLPGLTPSQGSGYGLPASMWSNTSGGGYIPSWNGDARSKNFVPDGIEVALRTSEGNKYGISKSGLVVGDPIRVNEIRSVQTRYAILSQISPSEGISVYHIDVPLLLGARAADRQALFQNQPDLELTTSFRPNSDAHGWILSTESGQVTFGDPYQPMLHFARSSSNLKGTNGRCTSVTSLPDVAALYHQVALQDRMQPVGSEPLDTLPIFIPQTAVMQRVVRYNTPPPRYNMMGADWINSTCILVYSFSVPSDPNASTTCRPVILDTDNTSPRHHIDPAASSAIVSELLAGETSEPSKFMFPPTQ